MSDDVTGWCKRGEHRPCSGVLRAATGLHWFCTCVCHPEPTLQDVSPTVTLTEFERVLSTFRAARVETGRAS